MNTREQLARIPDLATEVELTKDAPNPNGRVERHPLTFESKPPVSVAMIDALRSIDPDGESITPLWYLAQGVRVAWDEIRDSGEPIAGLPVLAEHPTYTSEAGWLLATMDLWQAVACEAALGYISQCIGDCYSELVRLAREPKPVLLRCLTYGCGGLIITDDSGRAAECENHHPIDHHEAVRRAKHSIPMSLPSIAEDLKVTERTLQRWATSGIIHHAAIRDGVRLYWFDEVQAAQVRAAEMRITWRQVDA